MPDPFAEYYSLLRVCFEKPPSRELLIALKDHAHQPPALPDHSDILAGWRRLASFFDNHTDNEAEEAAAMTHRLLLGDPLGPKMEPYASYYLEGTRQGMPLVHIRSFLKQWELIAELDKFKDFEDHATFMLDCLVKISELADREDGQWKEAMEQCLADHVLPWMPAFLVDLEKADEEIEGGGFYAGLARIGCGLLALEAQALA